MVGLLNNTEVIMTGILADRSDSDAPEKSIGRLSFAGRRSPHSLVTLLRIIQQRASRNGDDFDIRTEYTSTLLGEVAKERLTSLELSIIEGLDLRQSLAPKEDSSGQVVILPEKETQIAFETDVDFSRLELLPDNSLHYLDMGFTARPVLHEGSSSNKFPSYDNCDHIPKQLKEDVHLYNQFVFYAIQEFPVIVAIEVLNHLVNQETPTAPPPRSDGRPRTIMPTPLRCARDALVKHYMIATTMADEEILQNLGFDTTGYACDEVAQTSQYHFYKSMMSHGTFRMAADWTQFAEISHSSDKELQRILKSFKGISVDKSIIQ